MYASKAEQKRELSALNSKFEKTSRVIMRGILAIKQNEMEGTERYQELHDMYWAMPHNLFQFTAKKAEIFREMFPAEVEEIESMQAQREEIKAAPIVKPEPKTKREKAIVNDIKAIMERRKTQYLRGLELHEKFGKLNVHVNAHLVTNQYNTTFVRCFWYLNYELTPLSVILAVADATKED